MVKIGKFDRGWLKELKEVENIHAFSLRKKIYIYYHTHQNSMKELVYLKQPVQQRDRDSVTKKKLRNLHSIVYKHFPEKLKKHSFICFGPFATNIVIYGPFVLSLQT